MTTQATAPLSAAQKRVWFQHQFDPLNAVSNRPFAVRLNGKLVADALDRALNEIVRRHQSLRTVFPVEAGEPSQLVLPPAALALQTTDLRGWAEDEREAEARKLASVEAARPFDLGSGPLLRTKLLRLDEERHVLLVLTHHIIFDGWSETIFLNELDSLYHAFARQQASPLPELPMQYPDFAVWQEEHLQDGVLAEQVRYWVSQLAGMGSKLALPADYPTAVTSPDQRGQCAITVSRSVTDGLKQLCRDERVTLFMGLLAAAQPLLARYSGQNDFGIGVPVAGRNRAETAKLIGCFINTLVFRTRLSGNPTVRELLGRVRQTALEAYANQDLPFEKLVEELRPERRPQRWPIFQVMFQLRNLPRPEQGADRDIAIEPFDTGAGAGEAVDLGLEVKETGEGLRCSFSYDASLFSRAMVEQMAAHFRNLVESMVSNPDQGIWRLPLLDEAERRRLLVDWNQTGEEFPRDACAHQLIENRAARNPDAIAAIFGDRQIPYGELNRRANQLASHLRKLGAGPETLVAICMERSLEIVVGVLGILKSGGAYVPMDPAIPVERIEWVLEDARAQIVITQKSLAGKFAGRAAHVLCLDSDWQKVSGEDDRDQAIGCSPENLAYVIYTSGSTGAPKGAMIRHRSLVNYLLWEQRYFSITERDRLLHKSSLSFDDSVWEILLALVSGASVTLLPPGKQADSAQLIEAITRHHVTVACMIPSQLAVFLEEPDARKCTSLRRLAIGGEALPPELCHRFSQLLSAEMDNGYGPTEATVACLYFRCRDGWTSRTVPIGRPTANTETYILDPNLEPVPVGVRGELFIGGAQLARGYLNAPDLTAEKFIPHPFSRERGARLYRTGDFARYLPDGNVEFLGRIDHQVKVRGYRIEFGEVEAALSQHPAVRHAVVSMWEPAPGDRALTGYVVLHKETRATADDLRGFLGQKVPDYMVPLDWVFLDAMPLLPSGKPRRDALLKPVRQQSSRAEEAPRNELEARLKAIWEEVLHIEGIGIRRGFFELGGHSLLAVKVFARIERELGVRLPLATLLEAPTIEGLARAIALKRMNRNESWRSLVVIQRGRDRLPLFCPHGNNGNVLFYRDLALHLGEDQPVYGLQSPGLSGKRRVPESVEELARLFVAEIRTVRPQGPYCLAGYCMGAYIAFEMACQLQRAGETVGLLAVIGVDGSWKQVNSVAKNVRYHLEYLRRLSTAGKFQYVLSRLRYRMKRFLEFPAEAAGAAYLSADRPIPASILPRYVRGSNIRAH